MVDIKHTEMPIKRKRIWFSGLVICDLLLTVSVFLIPYPEVTSIINALQPEVAVGVLTLAALTLIFYFVSIPGLLLFKKWGRVTYLIQGIMTVPLIFVLGMTTIIDLLFLSFTVLVLACSYCTELSKEFK